MLRNIARLRRLGLFIEIAIEIGTEIVAIIERWRRAACDRSVSFLVDPDSDFDSDFDGANLELRPVGLTQEECAGYS
jgi:hypothetical protein